MKRLLITILAMSMLAGGVFLATQDDTQPASFIKVLTGKKVCEEPMKYTIGSIDSRFEISQEEFLEVVKKAESVWERDARRELFEYDPDASFSINLVFDERQRETIASNLSEERLEDLERSHQHYSTQYQNLYSVYKAERAAYEEALAAYKQQLERYNQRVEEWNQKGGAPSAVYEELEEEQAELVQKQNSLEEKKDEVNSLASQLNAIAEAGNTIAQEYNEEARTYVDRFGQARRFNQGEYRGDEVNIYQFQDTADLQLVLAHELGHALGIDHVDDPNAVMYYLMRDQNLSNPTLTPADVAALREVCSFAMPEK